MRKCASTIATVALLSAALHVPPASAGSGAWDERVAPIARQVEKIRHLEFDHPVPVRFLSEPKFEQRFAPDFSKLDFAQQSALQQRVTAMIALELLPADFDLTQLFATLKTSGLAGLYDGQQIWVKGTKLDPVVEYVLAHELTHVLQHQSFRSPKIVDELQGQAVAALREGEANWVARQYIERLPKSRRGTARRLVEERSSLLADLEGIPEVLGLSALAPYLYGEEFASAIVAREGTKGLDAIWKKPPRDDARVLDVLRAPSADRPGIQFDDPRTTGQPWRIGAIGLYYLLATGLNNVRALEAASHWQANATQSFRDGESDCVATVFLADEGGKQVLQDALNEWALYSGGRFSVEGEHLYVDRCTDDVAIIPPTPWARRVARQLAQLRSRIVLAGIGDGMKNDTIRCVTTSFLGNGVDLINELAPPSEFDVFPKTQLTLYRVLDKRRDEARSACAVELEGEAWSSGVLGDLN
jgi:hypothetical protein